MGRPEEIDDTVQQLMVSCENDCEEGFDVYMTPEAIVLVCRSCQTEYEISGKSAMMPGPTEFQ